MLKLLSALAFVLLVAPAAALRGPCDLKLVERKAYCPTCAMYVARGDVKAGACPKDKKQVETHDLCIKTIYVAKCHSTTTGLKPVTCCGNLYDKGTDDTSRVVWVCSGCKEKGFVREVKHADTCGEKKVVKSCTKSGMAPHSSFK